jgi:hypothetical protein
MADLLGYLIGNYTNVTLCFALHVAWRKYEETVVDVAFTHLNGKLLKKKVIGGEASWLLFKYLMTKFLKKGILLDHFSNKKRLC